MQLVRRGTGRDLRVDFFRGLALWWIFTDHIPGNALANYSLHNVAVCDAAELFVLLAGFAGAKAYAGAMDRHGWAYGAADAVKRAWTLYIAHIFLFVLYAAQVSSAARALGRPYYVTEVSLDAMSRTPFRAMLQALTLSYQPSMLNILPLYVAILLMFAAVMPLLRRPRLLLVLSLAMYMMTQVSGVNLPGWGGTGWYFDPFAWQLVFVIGAVLGYAPARPLPRWSRAADVLAVLLLCADLALIFAVQPNPERFPWLSAPLRDALLGIDKTGEAPARLASLLALLWLTTRLVPARTSWLHGRAAAPLTLLGQHSLPVFCSGIVLAFLGRLGMQVSHGVLMQAAVNAGGALAMLAVAVVAAWSGTPGRAQRPVRRASGPFAATVAEIAASLPQTAATPAATQIAFPFGHDTLPAVAEAEREAAMQHR